MTAVHPPIFTVCNHLQGHKAMIATCAAPRAGSCDQANCLFRLVRYRCYRLTWTL
jgi:hypothetical protein